MLNYLYLLYSKSIKYFFIFFNKNLINQLKIFKCEYVNSTSLFLCFLKISKKNFFNSIKNFFLFKKTPVFKRIFNFFSNYIFLNRYILNVVTNNNVRYFNKIGNNNLKFSIINPRFYFLNYEFRRQFCIARLFFNFNVGRYRKIFHNLKFINNLFSSHTYSIYNFYNYFLFLNNNKFSVLLKKNLILILYNNVYIKTNNNFKFSAGDTLKISFTCDFLYYYMFKSILKYKKYLYLFGGNNIIRGINNNKYAIRKKNIIKNKQIFYSYLTYKNFDVNFLT